MEKRICSRHGKLHSTLEPLLQSLRLLWYIVNPSNVRKYSTLKLVVDVSSTLLALESFKLLYQASMHQVK